MPRYVHPVSPPSTVGPPARYRYSIVIPTFQRREIVGATVSALIRMDHPSFEIIVVVDGSTDGTSAALAAMRLAVPLQVVEQQNLGASRARNRGAALARGDIILFLDDDMLAEPELLMQHDQAYADGADAVLGHMPVAASSPRSFLSRGVAQWAEERRERLAHTGGGLTLPDLLTGQLSVRRGLFESLNGFDEHFTRGGSFGGEDTDFGKRLLDARYHVVFAPAAVSSQHYAVSPRSNLQQWHQAGHADVTYVRKHPGEHDQIFASHRPHRRTNEYLLRPLARVPAISTPVAAVGRRVVVALAQRRPESSTVGKLFFLVRNLEYWRGGAGIQHPATSAFLPRALLPLGAGPARGRQNRAVRDSGALAPAPAETTSGPGLSFHLAQGGLERAGRHGRPPPPSSAAHLRRLLRRPADQCSTGAQGSEGSCRRLCRVPVGGKH